MLFFQMALLLGYLYAHWLHQKLRGRAQAIVHIGALAVSCALLPFFPTRGENGGRRALDPDSGSAVVTRLLTFCWHPPVRCCRRGNARTHKSGLPYRLFALSNFASMLALIGYPLLVEPNLTRAYRDMAGRRIHLLRRALRHHGVARVQPSGGRIADARDAALAPRDAALPPIEAAPGGSAAASSPWNACFVGLSASASVLLLAVTNHLTQDIAAIPFLWIAPLSAYLLSFILCFESPAALSPRRLCSIDRRALGFMTYQMCGSIASWKCGSP